MLVYLVDDDDVINYLNTIMIGRISKDIVIEIYKSGEELMEHILQQGDNLIVPDVVFLDIRMPEMSGFQLLDELIKLPNNPYSKAKIHMLSSTLDERDLERAKSNPMVSGFSSKPLSMDKFEEILGQKEI
ncbi:MAG: hypothetical protein RLY16_1815 [Bacteroidota bacterium]|jgi:CheY-like chemotaxis protein